MAFADNNIIPIQLDYRFVTTRKIWQYDYGQILSITGHNLPTATEVHFSLDIRGGSTLSRVGTTMDGVTTVKIPDELLKNNGKSGDFSIYAFIYVTDEESGNTEYRITIPVYSRPKPENPSVDPTPEPNIFHETVTAVNNAADRAEKAAKDTEQIRDNLNLDLSEKITRPQSAKVGQVIAVKEVGTDGKPTDFEAKDMTGGASTEEIKEAVGAYMQEHPFEETDPTVPDWAKQPEKPTYTAEDVGALPDNTKIPTKTSELENDSGFLVSPPTPEVGKILKIKSVNEDGTFTCEWADGGSNLDVRINGESIVQDGVAEIPLAAKTEKAGLVTIDKYATRGGIAKADASTGLIRIQAASKSNIDARNNSFCPIVPNYILDYAVKAAMCDGKGAAWTAEEQAAARERMGMNDWELIAEITIPEDAEEANALTIDTDINGKSFQLIKARLCALFPKYTGESTIPNYSFMSINGVSTGPNAPLYYTSAWNKLSKNNRTGMIYEIDISGPQRIEKRERSVNSGWADTYYGVATDNIGVIISDNINIQSITSIGGTSMLIYPGCKFMLYGVRGERN